VEDTKIYGVVNSPEATDSLRADLHNLTAWSMEWQMLNIEKCKVMHLGYNNSQVQYVMDGEQLQCVTEERDLGVIVSEHLKWEKQCSQAVKKANMILGKL